MYKSIKIKHADTTSKPILKQRCLSLHARKKSDDNIFKTRIIKLFFSANLDVSVFSILGSNEASSSSSSSTSIEGKKKKNALMSLMNEQEEKTRSKV